MTKKPAVLPRRSPRLARLTAALLLLASPALWAQDPAAESRLAAPEKQVVPASTGPIACPGCDLEGFDLAGRDLTSANLAGANLRGADFRGAVLDGIVLTGADLENANFDRARLDRFRDHPADLSRANLRGAVFRGAELRHTDFQYSSLHGTDFGGTDLTAAVLGPRIDAGVLPDGRKTSFREARLRRGFTTDATTMDLADVVWVDDPADPGAAAEIVCGRANLGVLLHRVYVGTDGIDSDSCGGSYAHPCRSIQRGIERCNAGGCGVLVAWGRYHPAAPVALTQGINLYGGCLPKPQARPDDFSVIFGPEGGKPAVTADNIETATLVQGFHFHGSPGPHFAGDHYSMPTTALRVANSTALTLADVMILAGQGGTGGSGREGQPGIKGVDADGRIGGKTPLDPRSAGGDGSPEMGVEVDVGIFSTSCERRCTNGCFGYSGYPGGTNKWSAGGKPGAPRCTDECPGSRGGTGHHGAAGAHGHCGTPGSLSDDRTGRFAYGQWYGLFAHPGLRGDSGAGGGGGGAGGFKAGSCVWVKVEYKGNAGGGGGSGATGNWGGGGARNGGASFAVVLVDSTTTFKDSRLVGGRSGDGGAGGDGKDGAKGGRGAAGATARGGGYGGHGGAGGSSGGSGGGGGGNSGPAVTVALVGNSQINTISTPLLLGQAGTPGHGGKSGAVGNGTPCPSASDGISGLVAATHQY